MLGYIKHNGESIATNGGIFHVGTVKDPETGYFIQSKARSFPTLEQAKTFIDAGKPDHAYRIKLGKDVFTRAEPVIGKWYCDFETRMDKDGKWYDTDGNLGEYVGEGEFVDEDGETINMSYGDYLVEQS